MLMTPPPTQGATPLTKPQYSPSSVNSQSVSPLAIPGQQARPVQGQNIYGLKQLSQNTLNPMASGSNATMMANLLGKR